MSKVQLKSLKVLLLFLPGVILWSLILRELYPIHLKSEIPFFFDLIEFPFTIPLWVVYFFGLLNLVLLFLISREIFPKKFSLIPPVIYSITPWAAYLVLSRSYFVYLLSLLLCFFYSALIIKKNHNFFANALFVVSAATLLYSSLEMFAVLAGLLAANVLLKFIDFNSVKKNLVLILILSLPLFSSMIINPVGFRNIYRSSVGIFSDPGLIGTVNRLQGESRRQGLFLAAKVVENKYLYFSQHFFYKFSKNIHPLSYFNPQEKLLGFSFMPPIFIGFLIPFIVGLYLMVMNRNLRRFISLPLIMVIPSLAGKSLIDLNKLVLVLPFIIFAVTFGLTDFFKNQKKPLFKIVLAFLSFFVILQLLVSLSDISQREYVRFERHYGNTLEVESR